MRNIKRRVLPLLAVLLVLVTGLTVTASAAEDPTEEAGTKWVECGQCGGIGGCASCLGLDPECEDCGGTFTCSACDGTGYVLAESRFYNTFWALLPPIIAIALALITKEVYSSLFVGILVGGLLYSNFSFEGTVIHVFSDGIVSVLSDGYNVGILVFLVILGAMVCLMNKAGGSAAFGRWAQTHIRSRVGAQLATVLLGCLIFIDDYFNCLTVGSVMRPITDKYQVSRAKLAYIIDATAAPICIIAPISSWAAAVAGFAEDGQGLALFIRAIPYNFYALLTIVMMIGLVVMNADYGPMGAHERNAAKGDLFSGSNPYAMMEEEVNEEKGRVLDLVLPIVVLVVFCVIGMIYSGGFFEGAGFIEAFSNSDASVGLMLGSAFALVVAFVYFLIRRSLSFKEMMGCIPEGFKAMVPAIMILTFAWSLKAMTDSLGAKFFVRDFVRSSAGGMQMLLPAIVFLIGCLLAFATGTSWGTFGILIPIVQNVFSMDNPLAIVCISACMAGAVCGDHCSPISDTTIMASAGAQCDHVNHVSTQLPYAITAAAVSCAGYLLAGIFGWVGVPTLLALPIAVVLMIAVLLVIRSRRAA
ncbi:Na+/H+ antiporter NhaC family protein [Dysosmobacter sp.]|uniref:Na+/H+ antiporter NhaC family protein n=1 Tax=Dysosmobacter sp. TaxID=2591382 RepID=UPI002A8C6D8D|nr:Na+/H+ antiporter NhaC family protein [Dysosmobacter sp.]MDY3282028.1 Na+/H+ antiporter NhaC family protein [Dysosmobacter sp.]